MFPRLHTLAFEAAPDGGGGLAGPAIFDEPAPAPTPDLEAAPAPGLEAPAALVLDS